MFTSTEFTQFLTMRNFYIFVAIVIVLYGHHAMHAGQIDNDTQRYQKVNEHVEPDLKIASDFMPAILAKATQDIDRLSFDARKTVSQHLLFMIFSNEYYSDPSLCPKDDLPDKNRDEFILGLHLEWKHCILESETDLFCKLLWGDTKIMFQKDGRLFPVVHPKLRKVFSVTDPRHESRYKDYSRSDSFVSGVILGRILAAKLVAGAESEAQNSLLIKDNLVFIKDPREKNTFILSAKATQELSTEEKQLRFMEVPSLEALVFFKNMLSGVPVQRLSDEPKTKSETPKPEEND